jgi:hypothetical protein
MTTMQCQALRSAQSWPTARFCLASPAVQRSTPRFDGDQTSVFGRPMSPDGIVSGCLYPEIDKASALLAELGGGTSEVCC